MPIDVKGLPRGLRKIFPFVLRANEIEKKDAVVAYYCLTYALEMGIALTRGPLAGDQEAMTGLMQIMAAVEEMKLTVSPRPEEGRAAVELFALKVFAKADEFEKSGTYNATTMRLFLMASYVMETTKQFDGGISEDFAEKAKYARWQATQVRKVMKGEMANPHEGEQQPEPQDEPPALGGGMPGVGGLGGGLPFSQPLPGMSGGGAFGMPPPLLPGGPPDPPLSGGGLGPPPGLDDLSAFGSGGAPSTGGGMGGMDDEFARLAALAGFGDPPPVPGPAVAPTPPPAPQPPPVQPQPPRQAPRAQPQPQASRLRPTAVAAVGRPLANKQVNTSSIPLTNITQAQKKAKFAVSSLQFDDINGARKFLVEALNLLGGL